MATAPAARWVARLTLSNFRNYAGAAIDAGAGPVVVAGDNGQGKTNLLEALSLLAPGRGLRGSALGEMQRGGTGDGWTVAAELAGPDGAVTIGTGTRAAAPERRQLRVNSATAPLATLGEWLSLLWVTPAMDRLFSDAASGRRRFLDRLVLALDPGHAVHVTRLDAALRGRARLLSDPAPDAAWLTGLERAIADHGLAVAVARRATVAALSAAAPRSEFGQATLRLDGWDETDADRFAALLNAARGRDAAAGRATAGPHRMDLTVTHAGTGRAAAQSSTGEQKALLLGLVLAHADLVAARTGRRAILLLDEVAAHLDGARRAALYARLVEGGAQAWLTGTDAALFAPLGANATWLSVSDGAVAVATRP